MGQSLFPSACKSFHQQRYGNVQGCNSSFIWHRPVLHQYLLSWYCRGLAMVGLGLLFAGTNVLSIPVFVRGPADFALDDSAMRERFPKLLRLDGHDLPPPITFDVETPTTLPPCKGSYLATDDIKALVSRFLKQYYACYDGEDRQGLLNVYHDEACCSLSIPGLPGQNPSRSSLAEYFNNSRNIKRLRDPALRFKLLKHKRLNVVSFLNELPRTQHDLNSFVVDITAQSNMLLCFVVNGVFKVEGQSNDPVRAFTRVFIAVPGTDGGLLLVNDEQFIRNATTEEIRKAFATPAPTPSSSPVPVLAPVPQDMVQAFSLFSGMNAEWSQKCLQDNGWDFEQAAQIFMKLKAEGKIPEVAFIK